MKILKNYLIILCFACCIFIPSVKASATSVEGVNSVTVENTGTAYWVIVDGYSLENGSLITGEDGIIKLSLLNTNTKKEARNVVLTISSVNDLILPQAGLSNQFYIDKIEAGGTEQIDIPVSVSSVAIGSVKLDISIEYSYIYDQGYASRMNNLNLSIPVSFSAIMSENVTLDSNTNNLFISCFNAGNKTVNNATVHISGDVFGNESYYIGSLQSAEHYNAMIPLNFLGSGNKTVKVYYSYKTESGESIQSELESYMFAVNDANLSAINNENVEKINGNVSLLVILSICTVIFIISFILGKGVFRKEK